jgi:hypothetical protein
MNELDSHYKNETHKKSNLSWMAINKFSNTQETMETQFA